jgi:medium-chain acyl-[acyl-carrier-protein] hydrolase
MYYNQWKQFTSKAIKIVPLELTGRGRRMKEDYYDNFDEAINDLLKQINLELDGSQFAFFGHSMGSTLAYELAHKILEIKNQEPNILFLSGRYPPHINRERNPLHLLSDKEFTKEIVKYGGMPPEVIKEKKLMEMVVPILKADFKILDGYQYIKKPNKLSCEIVVLMGKEDSGLNPLEQQEWKNHTTGSLDIFEFEGGHFYINNNVKKIIDIINWKLVGGLA